MQLISFYVPGIPQPKGSMKAYQSSTTSKIVVENANPKTKAWQNAVSVMARGAMGNTMPWNGPVELSVNFTLPRPKSASESKRPRPSVKPDLDKLLRAVCDGMEGIVYRNDSRIVRIIVTKFYDDSEKVGAVITVGQI